MSGYRRFEEIQVRISKHFGKGRLAKWLDADTDKQFVIKTIEDIKVEVANLSVSFVYAIHRKYFILSAGRGHDSNPGNQLGEY
jgi:hypothetical protein